MKKLLSIVLVVLFVLSFAAILPKIAYAGGHRHHRHSNNNAWKGVAIFGGAMIISSAIDAAFNPRPVVYYYPAPIYTPTVYYAPPVYYVLHENFIPIGQRRICGLRY